MYDRYRKLLVDRHGAILRVTLSNPPHNAITRDMHDELAVIFDDIKRDRECRVVVLTGAGTCFCAGGDVQAMQAFLHDVDLHMHMIANSARIIYGLIDCEKPIICRMNGHAMGLGASLALFCDMVIATERAKIADPHVLMGLSAGDGGALIWPLLVGFARAKEYLMLGDSLLAPRAVELGLIYRAVPEDKLDVAVDELAQRLSAGAHRAICNTKKSINLLLRQQATAVVEAHLKLELETIFGAEHREAVAAFLERRAPDFPKVQ